jgi:signal transduction histidine kinase
MRWSPKFHVFSFSNDGESIKKEDRENIFERFQRNGSEKHGGRVWVDPEKTRGATFHVTISKDLITRKQSDAQP